MTRSSHTKLTLIALAALSVAGCSHSNQGATASEKQAFKGTPDPAAEARDAQKFATFQKSHAGGPPPPAAGSPPPAGR